MNVERLIEHRSGLLFAEIGALVHDLGKLSEEFVGSKSEDQNYKWFKHEDILKYQNFLSDQLVNFLKDKTNSIMQIFDTLYGEIKKISVNFPKDKNKISFYGQFISKHDSGQKLFPIDLLTPPGADGVDSGIDKMIAESGLTKQRKEHTYIATAFGYEKEKIILDDLKSIRDHYADKLYNILMELKNNPDNIQNWINQRKELFRETHKAFLNALGETRRPANDVTLWDHSFSVASLFKAALTEILLTNWKDSKEINWRLLSVSFDGVGFCHSSWKIGDVLGRKELIKRILDVYKDVLEVIIPIGNEIYRDENGSVFLLPACMEDLEEFGINGKVWGEIKNISLATQLNYKGEWEKKPLQEVCQTNPVNLQRLLKTIASFISEGTFLPNFKVSQPSRGALNLGGEIKGRSLVVNVDLNRLQEVWENKKDGHERCYNCGLRPIPLNEKQYGELQEKDWNSLNEDEKNYIKAYERNICEFCLKLGQDRVKRWWENERWNKDKSEEPSRDTSIWIDEVADDNNRVALIYLSFDLSRWLNGEMLNTFLSKPLEILKNMGLQESAYDAILKRIDNNFNSKDETLWKILGSKHLAQLKTSKIFKQIVEDREPDWQKDYKLSDDNSSKAKVLLLFLTRKHPSFARIRRIWETTRNFSIDLIEEIKEKFLKEKDRDNQRENDSDTLLKRIIFEFEPANSVPITHTYWFRDHQGKAHEIAIVEGNKAVVVTKLDKEKRRNLKEFLSEEDEIEIYDEGFKTAYGKIKVVKENIDTSEYHPIIPFMFEPTNCLFFVPLKKAWKIVKFIKEQYEIHFNKVQDKLPLRLGFIAFHRRSPMYAVLDAARRMMEQEIKRKKYEVKEVCLLPEYIKEKFGESKTHTIYLYDPEKKKKYCYQFTTALGDTEKQDLFHPYFIVKNANEGWQTCVEGKWQTIKHVTEIKSGNVISFYPSYFDFIYLDTNTRRYDVGKKRKHWLFKHSPKPYLLKDIEDFERLRKLLNTLNLTTSQILNAYGFLMEKIREWELDKKELPIKDEVFEQFVENMISDIPFRLKKNEITEPGKINESDYDFLKGSILSGLFFDLIDMWHTVLKKKFKEDQDGK